MDIIYQERVPFPFVRRVVTVCIALILAFSITYCYLRLNGLLGDHPAPFWLFLSVLAAMVAVTLILANLVTLSIKMTEESAVVGFGIFRARVRWDDVRGCDLDRLSSFVSAANWGVSMGFVGGWWRRMYNVKGYPRVVLEMKRGRKALVFSTKNPDAVMDVVRRQVAGVGVE